jgi:hypothetical protein
MKTPQQIAANWASKMAGASANATAGAQAVQQSPGQAAAAQSVAYQQGVAANVQKWQTNVGAVSTAQWQQAYITKGIPRMASGAQAAQPKVAAFQAQLQPFQQALKSSLPPRGPAGQNDQRMLAWSAGMRQFKKTPGT